ncbi:MAG: hypothetical protein Q9202_005724 [Teloschistes flavicans]
MIVPSEKGVALLTVNAVFTTLAITSYVLRFRNNLQQARRGSLLMGNFIVTDSLVFGATLLVVLNCVMRVISIVKGGIGWDTEQLTTAQVQWANKSLFVEEISWTTSLCLLKFALIILYGRIFVSGTGRRNGLWIQFAAFTAVGGLLVGSITYYLTACVPVRASWTPGIGHCKKPQAGWLGTGIANLVTDVIIFSVPVVWVADLQMSLHNKIVVSVQLFIGAIVSIISFTRIFFVLKVLPANVTGTVVRADVFSCIELNMAIVFASVSGIAGREAISDVVHRLGMPRDGAEERSSSGGYRGGSSGHGEVYRRPTSGDEEIEVGGGSWRKLEEKGGVVEVVEEVREG